MHATGSELTANSTVFKGRNAVKTLIHILNPPVMSTVPFTSDKTAQKDFYCGRSKCGTLVHAGEPFAWFRSPDGAKWKQVCQKCQEYYDAKVQGVPSTTRCELIIIAGTMIIQYSYVLFSSISNAPPSSAPSTCRCIFQWPRSTSHSKKCECRPAPWYACSSLQGNTT